MPEEANDDEAGKLKKTNQAHEKTKQGPTRGQFKKRTKTGETFTRIPIKAFETLRWTRRRCHGRILSRRSRQLRTTKFRLRRTFLDSASGLLGVLFNDETAKHKGSEHDDQD